MDAQVYFFMYVHKGIGRFLSLLSENNLYLRGKTHTYRISLMRATYEQFFYMTLFLVILMDWRLPVEVAYNPIHIPLFPREETYVVVTHFAGFRLQKHAG